MADMDEVRLKPSVLDRLLGQVDARGAAFGTGQTMEELKESVRRDLENLLNTRWRISSSAVVPRHLYNLLRLECAEACDTTGEGNLNIVDAFFLLRHLFQGGPPGSELRREGDSYSRNRSRG